MTAKDLRQKFLEFFKEKGHAVIPSAPLIPENDPTTLFTGSGMQPMISYLLGEKHPLGERIADSQKCFRSQDIEDVGDNRHTTLFEMLGNWSLGDYFKREQIVWMFEFLTKEIGLDPNKIYVTAFRGNEALNIPRDAEAVEIWKKEFEKAGIDAKAIDFAEKDGMQGGRIFYYDEKKNWWSRSGVPADMPLGEPGGPDSEMFWDFGAELSIHENSKFKDAPCHVNCDCGRFLEIGNNVFMQYKKTENGFGLLPNGNIDFGGGLERLVAAANDTPDIFVTDLFAEVIEKIEEISGKNYNSPLRYAEGFGPLRRSLSEASKASQPPFILRGGEEIRRSMQIIADHIKAAAFILAEGLEPSNVERGYILRRLIRRAVRYGKLLGINEVFTFKIANVVVQMYQDVYPELQENRAFIEEQLVREEEKFHATIQDGLKKAEKILNLKKTVKKEIFTAMMAFSVEDKKVAFRKIYRNMRSGTDALNDFAAKGVQVTNDDIYQATIWGKEAFDLYQSYGFPLEMIVELAQERNLFVDGEDFREELKKHQELSRAGAEQKFKGGLADHSEIVTKYHTATHMLLAALRQVLGEHVFQKGSNITAERLRFDFPNAQKLTSDELSQVEKIVNDAIAQDLPVMMQEMNLDEAKALGAVGTFESRYGDKVKVYTIGDGDKIYSREICGGPHVDRTGTLGHFKILKEEAVSAGVRRIKAILQ